LEDGETASAFVAAKSLGLALKPSKEAVEVLVVDHVEKTPTES